jgi:PAS domain S-box-containing protein
MWVNGPDGGCEFVNQAYLDFFGKRLEEVLDCGWAPAAHPDDAERYVTSYLAAVERRSPFAAEARFMRSDGEYRWVRSTGVARISLDGEYLGHTGITQDISDRKQWERHQQLLVAELNHRVKNTLAVVQSLARQSFMPEKPPLESVGAYEGRLSALAAAHNLLTRENWDAAALDELIELAVSPFCSGSRCTIEGPPLRVAPQTAVTIALAMHELATNASKYGALSKSSGAPSIKSRSFVQQQ